MKSRTVDMISDEFGIKRSDLVEKDIIIHAILLDLSKDKFFSSNFLFKGGTCLVKSYLGYFRFSEDIDFTWRDQDIFQAMSRKATRRYLSGIIDQIGKTFEAVAEKRGLDFRCVKNNHDYVELGGSNRICTFKLWFDSSEFGRGFIKAQFNFIELLHFKHHRRGLASLASGNKKLAMSLPECSEYFQDIVLDVYDMREILCEKIRAMLTRKKTQSKDVIDAYLITKNGIRLDDIAECAASKTGFAAGLYVKYNNNLQTNTRLLESGRLFSSKDEKKLFLSELDEDDYRRFLEDLQVFLKEMVVRI